MPKKYEFKAQSQFSVRIPLDIDPGFLAWLNRQSQKRGFQRVVLKALEMMYRSMEGKDCYFEQNFVVVDPPKIEKFASVNIINIAVEKSVESFERPVTYVKKPAEPSADAPRPELKQEQNENGGMSDEVILGNAFDFLET